MASGQSIQGGPHRTPQMPLLAVQASLRGFTASEIGRWTPPGHLRGTLSPRVRAAWPRLGPGWVSAPLFRPSSAPDPRRVSPDPVPCLVNPRHAPDPLFPCPDEGGGWPSRASAAGMRRMRCPVPRVRSRDRSDVHVRGGECPFGARERERRVEAEAGDGGGAGQWGDCGRGRARVGASSAGLVGGGTPPGVGEIFGVPPRARRGSPRLTWAPVARS